VATKKAQKAQKRSQGILASLQIEKFPCGFGLSPFQKDVDPVLNKVKHDIVGTILIDSGLTWL